MTTTSAPGFTLVEDWGVALPALWRQDVSDITVDAAGAVYLLFRNPSAVVVCAPNGAVRRTIGDGVLGPRAHGVTVGQDGLVHVVDEGANCIRTFDERGEQVGAFGSGPTNPAFTVPVTGNFVAHIDRAYPPFSRPTRVAVTANGERYVSDGYGNCRVHHFGAELDLLRSWGTPGTEPGQFHIPHDVYRDGSGRVLICDRENDRIQVFIGTGEFVAEWTDLRRPQGVVEGPDGLFYVSEGAWRQGHVSQVHGPVDAAPSRVSVLDGSGRVVGRLGDGPGVGPGWFLAAHGIAVDGDGDLYVAEVSRSVAGKFPEVGGVATASVQKFRRRG